MFLGSCSQLCSLTVAQIRYLPLRRSGSAQRGAVLRTRRPVHSTRPHRTQSNLRSAKPAAPWRHLHASDAVWNAADRSEHSRSDVVVVCDGMKAESDDYIRLIINWRCHTDVTW